MRAYIDESGNTGLNLFDAEQPNFLNVAMSSTADFDSVFKERVKSIAQRVGAEYLHGSVLGVSGVESIALSVIELVDFSQVQFNFAFVRKPDVAVMKFFDAVFDPGENPAAPQHSYAIRSLRFLLLLKFSAVVHPGDAKTFWEAMTSTDSPKSRQLAVSAIESVLQRVPNLPDMRSRELIGESLNWAKENIGELSIWSSGKQLRYGHLPNIFTFPALMEGISVWAKRWDSKVEKIIHDRQSQFAGTLRQWHSIFSGVEPERIFHFGDTPMKFPNIGDSQFEIGDSKFSAGLQIVDIVLWTFSRTLTNKSLGPHSTDLFNLCFSPDDVFTMSLGWMEREVEETMSTLMSKPISEDDLLRGKDLMDQIERIRQRRMQDYSTD